MQIKLEDFREFGIVVTLVLLVCSIMFYRELQNAEEEPKTVKWQ